MKDKSNLQTFIKKKHFIRQTGFTLIELLATLAILGVVTGIAVPAVGNIREKAKQSAYDSSVALIEKASTIADVDGLDYSDGVYGVYTVQDLIDEGYLSDVSDETLLSGYTSRVAADRSIYVFNGDILDTDEEISDRINPDDSKWVEKGNWGTNGKWVVDEDGNAVIYAIDASKPIVFHNMETENAKLPKATMTTLTFQDKVQGDTNSSMNSAFTNTSPNFKTINNLDTNVDTSNVIDMSGVFSYSQLTSVGDLGKWNTSNVKYMAQMFSRSQLTSVGDLSQWNTFNVTDMSRMFEGSQLTSVGDLGKWNTSNLEYMSDMFSYSQLTSVGDLSKWNTSKVIYMREVFRDSKLTSVGDLSQWDTANVKYMNGMFWGSNLTTVGDLSQWNTSNVTNMYAMFQNSKLTPPAWYR